MPEQTETEAMHELKYAFLCHSGVAAPHPRGPRGLRSWSSRLMATVGVQALASTTFSVSQRKWRCQCSHFKLVKITASNSYRLSRVQTQTLAFVHETRSGGGGVSHFVLIRYTATFL